MTQRVKYWLLFVTYLILTLLLYRHTARARFVYDFIDWYFTYQQMGAEGLLHSFNDPSLHHVYHLFFYGCVKLFDKHPWAWQVVFCAIHALNATLLFRFLEIWLRKGRFEHKLGVAFFASVLFLISPYQTEVVVWGATIHYLLIVTIILLQLNILIGAFLISNTLRATLSAILFATGLFTHEIIMVLPAVFLLFIIYSPKGVFNGISRLSLSVRYVLPQVVIVLIYFLLNRLLLGKWIGHYGAAAHLKFNFYQQVAQLLKYMLKYVVLAPFLPNSYGNKLYGWTESSLMIWSLVVIFLAVAMGIHFKRNSNKWVFGWVLLIAAIVMLFPVLNLYFPTWVNIQADRLGYVASTFIYSFICCLLYFVFNNKGQFILLFYGFVSVMCLRVNTQNWYCASTLQQQLEKDFPANPNAHYYILNLPDNFNGAYMFRSLGKSKLAASLKMKTNKNRSEDITEVYGYNLNTVSDSVIVNVVDSITLNVELSHWGNWFWKDCAGADNYENEELVTTLDEYKHSYKVTFKRKSANDIYLYQAGKRWQRVKGF